MPEVEHILPRIEITTLWVLCISCCSKWFVHINSSTFYSEETEAQRKGVTLARAIELVCGRVKILAYIVGLLPPYACLVFFCLQKISLSLPYSHLPFWLLLCSHALKQRYTAIMWAMHFKNERFLKFWKHCRVTCNCKK